MQQGVSLKKIYVVSYNLYEQDKCHLQLFFRIFLKPQTYNKDIHQIEINQIDQKALYILEKLISKGHLAYLVGGSVRDLLLKQTPKDFDISTSARPEEIKTIFPSTLLIGKRFRLAHVRFGRKIIEVSTFRSGGVQNEQLITEDNIWGTPQEDVLRRDFTINGLFYDCEKELVIDYVEGFSDVKNKVLRVIGVPYQRFKQDPVRMIRCLKFQARFGLSVEEDARLALVDCKKDITKSSQARILEEVMRMLESGSARVFFQLMTDHGVLQEILPKIASFLEIAEGNQIYLYLDEADKLLHSKPGKSLDRAVLVSCLIFPLFEQHIKNQFISKNKTPHFGEIFQESNIVLNKVFQPFLMIPKRLKIQVMGILTSQYRLTPLRKKKDQKIRIPRAPEFNLALKFFSIRCSLEPGLTEIYHRWNDAFKKIDPLLVKKRIRTKRPPRK